MKKALAAAFIAQLFLAASSRSYADEPGVTGNINLALVSKALEEDDWSPLDEQTGAGIEADIRGRSWPVSIAFGYQKTQEEDGDLFSGLNLRGTTAEIDIGVKKIWDQFPHVRPIIGGGLTRIKATVEAPDFNAESSDSGSGLWIAGGVYWTLADHLNLGLSLKISRAKADMGAGEFEAGGNSGAFLIGYHY